MVIVTVIFISNFTRTYMYIRGESIYIYIKGAGMTRRGGGQGRGVQEALWKRRQKLPLVLYLQHLIGLWACSGIIHIPRAQSHCASGLQWSSSQRSQVLVCSLELKWGLCVFSPSCERGCSQPLSSPRTRAFSWKSKVLFSFPFLLGSWFSCVFIYIYIQFLKINKYKDWFFLCKHWNTQSRRTERRLTSWQHNRWLPTQQQTASAPSLSVPPPNNLYLLLISFIFPLEIR